MFDFDDLSFFYFHGLGFRHTELELGLQEAKYGTSKSKNGGDAVSLAYAYKSLKESLDKKEGIQKFQKNLESFITDCYKQFHRPENHYNDAAFSLVKRGRYAKNPYDFTGYPLGKCGSAHFDASQVVLTLSSADYDNPDIETAILNTLLDLKANIKRLKIEMLESCLEQFEDPNNLMIQIIQQIIELYKDDVWIDSDIYKTIMEVQKDSDNFKYVEQEKITYLQQCIAKSGTEKKSQKMFSIKVQAFDLENVSKSEIKELLLKAIQNQNLTRVRKCLDRLQPGDYDVEDENPLSEASWFADLEILKAIHDKLPNLNQLAKQNRNQSPPLYNALYGIHYDNARWLLTLDGGRILPEVQDDHGRSGPKSLIYPLVIQRSAEAREMLKDLIKAGSDVNHCQGYSSHPMTSCCNQWYAEFQETLEIVLPHANALSKIYGILSATSEMKYAKGNKEAYHIINNFRITIAHSLTPDEIIEIEAYYSQNHAEYPFSKLSIESLKELIEKCKPELEKSSEQKVDELEPDYNIQVSDALNQLSILKGSVSYERTVMAIEQIENAIRPLLSSTSTEPYEIQQAIINCTLPNTNVRAIDYLCVNREASNTALNLFAAIFLWPVQLAVGLYRQSQYSFFEPRLNMVSNEVTDYAVSQKAINL